MTVNLQQLCIYGRDTCPIEAWIELEMRHVSQDVNEHWDGALKVPSGKIDR
jgi:hypothetical protein